MQEPIKVLIVDDHDLILCGVESVLEKFDKYQIIQKCNSVEKALFILKTTSVDLIITDLHFQNKTGIELAVEVKKWIPQQKILMLTLEDHPEYIRAAINANINGYVLKSDDQKKLILAIEEVCRVGEYFSPAVTRILSWMPQTQKAIEKEVLPPTYYHLTPREREVLMLIAKSETNAEIMEKLNILPPTLATHRQNLLRKLGEKNDVGLSKFAFKYGLVKWE